MTPALPGPQHRRIAPDGFDAWREAFRIIQAHEIWKVYGDFVTTRRPQLGSGIRERMQAASQIGADHAGLLRMVANAAGTRSTVAQCSEIFVSA